MAQQMDFDLLGSRSLGGRGAQFSTPLKHGGDPFQKGPQMAKSFLDGEPKRSKPTKNVTASQTSSTPMPKVDHLTIPTLNNPFKKAQAIVISTESKSSAESIQAAKDAFKLVYTQFDSMKPYLSFKPNPSKMKCKGSYSTEDKLDTTTFEAQVWKVHPSISGQKDDMFILEFRNKSVEGRGLSLSM